LNKLTMHGSTLGGYGAGANENGITFNTTSGLYSEIIDIFIDTFKIGVADLIGVDLFMFNFVVSNCGKGVSQNHSTAVDTFLDVEIGNFESCTVGIDMLKATSASFTLLKLEFIHTAAETAILYTGGAGGYVLKTSGGLFVINGCMYNLVGTFLSGFDFTIARDANIQILSSVGTEDKVPHAKINTIANATTTTVTTAGTYYKAAFTNGETYTCKFTLADGRMTFLSKNPRDGRMWVSGSAFASNANKTATFAIRKGLTVTSVSGNGTTVTVTTTVNHNLKSGNRVQMLSWAGGTGTWNGLYVVAVTGLKTFTYLATGNGAPTGGTAGHIFAPMSVRMSTASQPYPFSFNAYAENLQENDVFDLYVTSAANGDVITLYDLTWLVDSQ
jgi:hypothetical protein